jgi:hypothetical protein
MSRMCSHAKSVSRPNTAGWGFAKGGSRPSYSFSSGLIHALCLDHNLEKYRAVRSSRRGSRRSDRLPALGNTLAATCSTEGGAKKLAAERGVGGPYAGRPAEHQMLASRRRGHRFASGTAMPSRSSPVTEPLDIGVIHHVAKSLRQCLHRRLDVVVRQGIQRLVFGGTRPRRAFSDTHRWVT